MSDRGVVTLVQARSASTRLPGKVLLPLAGGTVLARQLERLSRARMCGRIVVATTTLAADDAIATEVEALGFDHFRGHPTDLLDRHFQAAVATAARHVVKIPSDCPLIDPGAVDRVLDAYFADPAVDFASNLHPPTWPDGQDVEVMTFAALERAWNEARSPHEREHTTPYLWDNPHLFRIRNVRWETGLDHSMSHRLVLDYQEDYALVRAVYEILYPTRPAFTLADVLELLSARPDIAALNAVYRGVNWYRNHLDVLRTVGAADTRSAPQESDPTRTAGAH